jgi:hypothetical protein
MKIRYYALCMLFVGIAFGKIIKLPWVNKRHKVATLQGARESSYPYISGDTFRAICDFVVDEKRIPFDTNRVQHGDVIFVKGEYLHFFFKKIHRRINKRYILVTHNSDDPAPGRFPYLLPDDKIIAWFGQNCDAFHPKFFPIPIGIANKYLYYGNPQAVDEIRQKAMAMHDRPVLIYLNITASTHSGRQQVENFFSNKPWCVKSKRKPYKDYLEDLTRCKFVISPAGTGLDCFRTWEVLLMGATPVMLHSTLDPLFEGLPVLLVNNWSEVTEEFLKAAYERMKTQTFKMERMFADYWLKKIGDLKRSVKQQYGI